MSIDQQLFIAGAFKVFVLAEYLRQAEDALDPMATEPLADAIALAMPLGVSAFLKGGSLDFGGTGVLSVAGGMYLPDRWVYYSLIINWTDAEAGSSAEVQDAYAAAAHTIFTLVRDRSPDSSEDPLPVVFHADDRPAALVRLFHQRLGEDADAGAGEAAGRAIGVLSRCRRRCRCGRRFRASRPSLPASAGRPDRCRGG
jgi:hypothetical protein